MRSFSDLPSDLNDQLETGLPPPFWFPVTGVITTAINPAFFHGADPTTVINSMTPGRPINWASQFGDREEETEVDPIEILDSLKLNQEMLSTIPAVANRYTEIDPISPMFRANRPKYGYGGLGEFTSEDKKNLAKVIALFGLIYIFLLRKKK